MSFLQVEAEQCRERRKARGGEEPEGRQDESFSQLDPDILAELPEEVVREVRQQYARREGRKGKSRTAFDKMMRTSPKKAASPVKQGKGKRGRPKGSVSKTGTRKTGKKVGTKSGEVGAGSISGESAPLLPAGVDMEVFNSLPQELRKEVEAQMRLRHVLPASTSSRKLVYEDSNSRASNMGKTFLDDGDSRTSVGRLEETSQEDGGQAKQKAPPQGSAQSQAKRPPQFCGRTEVAELRPLLKAWLRSTDSPLQVAARFLLALHFPVCKIFHLDFAFPTLSVLSTFPFLLLLFLLFLFLLSSH